MARLVVSDGSSQRIIDLNDAISVAGRAPENKIVIDDKQSSRRHFQIEKIDIGFKLVDLESRNGTRVNDRQVNQALLRPGDRITIGKHTLTFEDSTFREPPPEVAARLAPASSPRMDPPSSSADSTSDRPAAVGGLPVATEAARPAPPPPPPPPPIHQEPDVRSRRNRSGHTTAIQKTFRTQLHEEQKTLTMVAVGAGVFIFVIIILIIIPSSSSEPVAPRNMARTAGMTPAEAERSEREREEFEELAGWCDKNKANPVTQAEMLSKCDQFKQKYPRTLHLARLEAYRKGAADQLKAARTADFDAAEKQAHDDLKRNDFGGALRKIDELLVKYRGDVEIRERLVKAKDDALEGARAHFQAKRGEADGLKDSRKDEAREIYLSIIKAMGDGKVSELEDYCRIARASIEGLQ